MHLILNKKKYQAKSLLIKIIGILSFTFYLCIIHCSPNNSIKNNGSVNITGIVLDSKTKTPIKDVLVGLTDFDTYSVTNSDGQFFLDKISRQKIFLYFIKENYLSKVIEIKLDTFLNSNTINLDSIFLLRNYAVICGNVYNKIDSITPVFNASIKTKNNCVSCFLDSALTDSFGFFNYKYFPYNDSEITFIATCYGFIPYSFNLFLKYGDSININLYLQPYIIISGKIVSSDSLLPISKVKVVTYDDTCESDENGIFNLKKCIPSNTKRTISFIHDLFDTLTISQLFNTNVILDTIKMQRAKGTIRGNVILQGKKNNAGAIIQLLPINLYDTTDLLGNYEIKNIPTGTYIISIINKNYFCKPCTATVISNKENIINFYPAITSGNIEADLEWFNNNQDTNFCYTISDTLSVDSGVNFKIHDGAKIFFDKNSFLIFKPNARLLCFGETNNLIQFSSKDSNKQGNIIFKAENDYSHELIYTKFTNINIVINGGFKAKNCIFFANLDTNSTPLLDIYSINSINIFENCDFSWYNSKKGPIFMHNDTIWSETKFINCIFYNYNKDLNCNGFIKSKLLPLEPDILIQNCNFYNNCKSQFDFSYDFNADTSFVFFLEPKYIDIKNSIFYLDSNSMLLDKSDKGSFIGALGAE